MHDRRTFLRMFAAAGAAAPLAACSGQDMDDYRAAMARLRADLSNNPDLAEFVRYATLAANGHNTQPWRFAIGESGVAILPDFARRTPVVDPDDHHLFVSLGCAAENLLIAAHAHGRPGEAVFDDGGDGRIEIELARGAADAGALYDAIPARQSTRSDYDGRAVPADDLRLLAAAADMPGVSLLLITDAARRNAVRDFVVAGNSAQMDDPAFVRELRDSIRFSPTEALASGDRLFTASSGNPILPGWLGRALFSLFFRKDAENEKYVRQMDSSAGVAVFIGDRQDKSHWVRVGRSFQRFTLQATVLGIRCAHVNQPIEVPAVRTAFADWLELGDARPDLVVRYGYAPPLPMSPRRPVDAVIV